MSVNNDSLEADERAAHAPIYVRIQRHFIDRISSGELTVGDRLPTEMEIARNFGTSRATVQSAMSRLVHEGLIAKQVGRGTFVANNRHTATIDLDHVRSFEEDVASFGDHVTYRLLNVGRMEASDIIAEHLQISVGTTIFAFERLRLVGGEIIGMERRFFAPQLTLEFPVDALDTKATHTLVEQYLGERIGRMEVTIRATVAETDVATKLDLAEGAPLLLRGHSMYSRDNDLILYGEAFYREPFAFRYTATSDREA